MDNVFDDKTVVKSVNIERVSPNSKQPRKTFDDESISELAQSVKTHGVLQPILVEEISKDSYRIISGERRYRAAKIAGLKTIPVIVKNLSNLERMEVSVIENVQRQDLNPVEEAFAYAYLLQVSGMRQEDVAGRLGKSRSTIANSIRLLQLPQRMQDSLLKGEMSAGHGRALLSVSNPAQQEVLYRSIIKNGLSVREAEKVASDYASGKKGLFKVASVKNKDSALMNAEDKFMRAFGSKVEIKGNLKSGKIVIEYLSDEDLERIYGLLSSSEKLFD